MSAEYVSGPGVTAKRYQARPDGGVFDTWGGYGISGPLWQRRLAEGRSDKARHHFVYEDRTPESHGMGHFTQWVRCDRCGEERSIGISVGLLNLQERWCIAATQRRAANTLATLCAVFIAACVVAAVVAAHLGGASW